MFHEILQKIESAIHQQMEEKFGLSAEQTAQSASVVKESLREFFSQNLSGNPQMIQGLMSNIQNLEHNETFNQLRTSIAEALEKKAGLSPEMAAKVRDLSFVEALETIKQEFTNDQGQIDLQKVISKISIADFSNSTKDIFGAIGGMFKK